LELEAENGAIFGGKIEVDESYFEGERKKKRRRGAAGKILVFGMLKRGRRVYTKIISDASSKTLIPISNARLFLTVLLIQTARKLTTYWVLLTSSTLESATPKSLKTRNITSTKLIIFGTKRSAICASSTVFRTLHSAYI
jgi:hypothetical protein